LIEVIIAGEKYFGFRMADFKSEIENPNSEIIARA